MELQGLIPQRSTNFYPYIFFVFYFNVIQFFDFKIHKNKSNDRFITGIKGYNKHRLSFNDKFDQFEG